MTVIIMSPQHAKALIELTQANMAKWEDKHGDQMKVKASSDKPASSDNTE